MSAKFVSVTPDAETLMAYCARVSNPSNQNNENYARLLRYCVNHKHWSIFEQASMTVEIETTRGIAAQILRHRSFTFQEFSQRYADASLLGGIPVPELRKQDHKNRQNSTDDLDPLLVDNYNLAIDKLFKDCINLYKEMISDGVAKECARFVLPLATPTRLYMSGTIRSWITYIALREKNGTQKEHMDIAKECKSIFCELFPTVAEALGGSDELWCI